MTKLTISAEHKDGLTKHSFLQADGNEGDANVRAIEMVLWNHPGNDVSGMLARVKKMATTMEIVRAQIGAPASGTCSTLSQEYLSGQPKFKRMQKILQVKLLMLKVQSSRLST